MRVLRVFPRVAETAGGMEAHIRWLTDEQRRMGIRCFLLMNEGMPKHEDDLLIAPNQQFYDSTPAFTGIFRFYIQVIRALVRDPLTADVLHLHGDWSTFIFAPVIKRITRCKKVFFSFHGMLHQGIAHRWLLPFTVRFCDKFFVTGYQNYEQLAYTGKMVFQPSGIRPVFFTGQGNYSPQDAQKIVTTCIIRPQKNIETVLKIARILPQYQFVIIGDGPDRERLNALVELWQIKNVKFEGHLSPEAVTAHLRSAALFLFTSLEEGTPTAVLEAMACGLPVVSSNAGGTESVVEGGINGFVVKQDYTNESAYIPLIEAILSDNNLKLKMQFNNVEKSKMFTWESVAKRITSEIQS